MTKRLVLFLTAALAVAAFAPSGAAAASCPPAENAVGHFGIAPGCFDGAITAGPSGTTTFTQAGGHPYDLTTHFDFNLRTSTELGNPTPWPEQPARDIVADAPPGLIGNPQALTTTCPESTLAIAKDLFVPTPCPRSSQVGVIRLRFPREGAIVNSFPIPVFNLPPPTGSPARFGFNFAGVVIVFDARLRSESDYGISIVQHGIPEGLPLIGFSLTFWGTPADSGHDAERGDPFSEEDDGPLEGSSPRPFLTMPAACTKAGEGLTTTAHVGSWFDPADFNPNGSPDLSDPDWDSASYESHLPPGYPAEPATRGTPQGTDGCDIVPLKATTQIQASAQSASTPSGLSVHLELPNPGLQNPLGIASSSFKAAKVTLPQGMTINPSQAEGLGTCSIAQYESTELSFFPTPGKGCPSDAKIGSVEARTPLLDETIPGDVYVATPHQNPFDSLLALYIVLREPQRGILVKLAGKVTTDESTGQILASFDDLPQLPVSSFDFHFREGARAPLVTPPACGTYTTTTELTPYSDPTKTVLSSSDFQVTSGVGGSPCPSGGLPPFKPGLIAGSINNNAGSYSPFNLRLFRADQEQEITHFSIKLPPGISGKLAGVPFCSEAAIAAAKAKTGAAELASPSCPKASEVGHSLAGAGVGSVLAYVPGKIYLAGPYNGSALSVLDITAAKVGPFDLGTVLVRQALKVDPETAEVFIDATGSDPIPHIIDGITVHLRDIRAYVDRPQFTLNPTSCDRTSTASTVLGSGLDFASAIDDRPVTVTTPYQAANCASLGFKPKLSLSLSGGTKRGENPKFKAVLNARPGDANIGAAEVTLPHSEFLDQAHIKTICTRVQFNAGAGNGAGCPAASIYGYAKAITPLLDEPLEGPVFLRSSSHNLPDLVAALNSGKIDIALDGRIDSVGDGQIRNTFEEVPDAPVTRFTLTMQGGKKGLLVNSANLCARKNRAIANFTGQNGKVHKFKPILKAPCSKRAKAKAKQR